MNITDIRVYTPKENDDWGKTAGLVNITFDDVFAITGIKIINNNDDVFVAMPNKYDKNTNEYKDICFPVTAEFRLKIIEEVLAKFNKNNNNKKNNDITLPL